MIRFTVERTIHDRFGGPTRSEVFDVDCEVPKLEAILASACFRYEWAVYVRVRAVKLLGSREAATIPILFGPLPVAGEGPGGEK